MGQAVFSTRTLRVLLVAPVALALASVALAAVACAGEPATPTPSPVAQTRPAQTPTPIIATLPEGQTQITIYLSEASGAYQTGSATLTDIGGKTRVIVNVSPSMPNAQPIHIHMGTCSAVGTISDKLEDVVVGKSSTEIDKPLREVASGGKVINVHLSASDIRTYTACGDIPVLPAAASINAAEMEDSGVAY